MELGTILKAIGQMTLRTDFKEFFIKSSAQVQYIKSEFEDVENDFQLQIQEPPEEEDQFTLEADEQEESSSIKTYQFNSSMIAPSNKLPQPNSKPPSINLVNCPCLFYGYNSKGRNNYASISKQISIRACGCCLFLCKDYHVQKPSSTSLYLNHKYPINTLKYYPQGNFVLSGSSGKHPEILLWKYHQSSEEQEGKLQLLGTFRQPRKSQGVSFMGIYKEKFIVSVDVISLHRSCSLYLFDMNTQNKITQTKLGGKVFDFLISSENIIVLTDKGICEIEEQYDELTVNVKSGHQFCSLVQVKAHESERIIYADCQGYLYNQPQKKTCKAHNGWINMLVGKGDQLYSSGADEGILRISEVDSSWNIHQKWRIELKSYCTSLSIISDSLISIGCRDGSTQLYNTGQRKPLKKSNFAGSYHQNSSKCFYSKHSQRLIFPILFDTQNKALFIDFPPSKQQKQSIIEWQLKQKTFCMDIYGNEILQVLPKKGKKYPILITDLVEQEKKRQLKVQMDEKITAISFNGSKLAIGDENGSIIVFRVKDQKTNKSKENHSKGLEDVIWDQSGRFLKTISCSELFYWEVKENSDGFQIVKVKPKVVKEAKWTRIGKYSWECKKVWEYMTHYNDISAVDKPVIQNQIFLCVALYDGNLRIYNFPAAKSNYREYKLFNGSFELICQENWIMCSWKGMTICFEGKIKID